MSDIVYPPVVVVDENDNEIGSAMLSDIWRKGLYHRTVAIFVFDDMNRMLLQLRSPSVKICPSLWDQAAGGHVDQGQDYENAALNELAEELGLKNISLEEVGTHRSNATDGDRTINQFERVYKATVATGTTFNPELTEVTELRWFTSKELKQLIASKPNACTPGLLYDLQRYFSDY